MKLKNLRLVVQQLVFINPAIEARNILKDGTKSHTSSLNKVEVREVVKEISILDLGSTHQVWTIV